MTRKLAFRQNHEFKEVLYEPSRLELYAEDFSRTYNFFLRTATYQIDEQIGGFLQRRVEFRALKLAVIREDNRIQDITYGKLPSLSQDEMGQGLENQIQALITRVPKREFLEIRYTDGELVLLYEPSGEIEVSIFDKCAEVAHKEIFGKGDLKERKKLYTRSYQFTELDQAIDFVGLYFKAKYPRNQNRRATQPN